MSGPSSAFVAMISRHVADWNFPAHLCSLNVPVALSEALSNAMLRGNKEDPAKRVRIRVIVETAGWSSRSRMRDAGSISTRCTQDPTTPANVVREDGRGLFLMRRLTDRVERYTEAHGLARNVVRLTIERPPAVDGS